MKVISTIPFLCVLQITVHAWVGIIESDNSTLRHGYCFSDMYNIGELNKNEEKRIQGMCAIARCQENKNIYISGCGVVNVKPPCYVTEGDLSKPYPDCCFEIRCPENNKL